MKHRIQVLDIHASMTCNLSCQGCTHLSDFNLPGGSLRPEQAVEQFALWKDRLLPTRVAIVGGEPLLNKNVIEFCRVTREAWPDSRVVLLTNGFFLHRHPDLPQTLIDNNIQLIISQHGKKPTYLTKWRTEVAPQVWRLRKDYPDLNLLVRKSFRGWAMPYETKDGKPVPSSSDPAAAHKICMQRKCTQLYKGRLYKCPYLAYFDDMAAKIGADGPEWAMFRDYKGLEHTCTDAELADFVKDKPIPECSLCPSHKIPFVHPDPTVRRPL